MGKRDLDARRNEYLLVLTFTAIVAAVAWQVDPRVVQWFSIPFTFGFLMWTSELQE